MKVQLIVILLLVVLLITNAVTLMVRVKSDNIISKCNTLLAVNELLETIAFEDSSYIEAGASNYYIEWEDGEYIIMLQMDGMDSIDELLRTTNYYVVRDFMDWELYELLKGE